MYKFSNFIAIGKHIQNKRYDMDILNNIKLIELKEYVFE